MTKIIIWLVLSDLGPDALKAALAFVVAIVVALAFTIASLITETSRRGSHGIYPVEETPRPAVAGQRPVAY